jgi:uncharacterized sulfatase
VFDNSDSTTMKMSRPIPLLFLWGILLASDIAASNAGDKNLNVVFLVSDDLANRLGCYGDKKAVTPSLDALARKGVRFDRAYCQFPLCNPSRASFLTGLRPDTLKVYENATQFRKTVPDAVSLPQTFSKAGYFVARVGKLYHYGVPGQIGTAGLDDPTSWQETVNPSGRDKTEEADVLQFTGQKGRLGASISYLKTGGDGLDHTDGLVADNVIGLIRKHKGSPFFIAGGFYRPHVPCVAAEPFFALYDRTNFDIPSPIPPGLDRVPPVAFFIKPPNYDLDAEKLSQFTRAYHASISQMDAQVGRVLKAIEEEGLADSTVVVFISDHGYLLGEHGGQWMKMSLFEESSRVPMIIYAPGRSGNGRSSRRIVELVDLHATLAELCGLQAPKTNGESFVRLLDDPDAAWDHPAYTQVTRNVQIAEPGKSTPKKKAGADKTIMGRSVRSERFRYVEWDRGKLGVELYDHQVDPAENENVAKDPAYEEVIIRLKSLLPRTGPSN